MSPAKKTLGKSRTVAKELTYSPDVMGFAAASAASAPATPAAQSADPVLTSGLTRREIFATTALQGLLSTGKSGDAGFTASMALAYADALVTALAKKPEGK